MVKKLKVKTAYSDFVSKPKIFKGDSMTKTSLAFDTDINVIYDKYVSGQNLNVREDLMYIDDTITPTNYSDAKDLLNKVDTIFNNLPSNVRAAFNYNPADFVAAFNGALNGNQSNLDKFAALKLSVSSKSIDDVSTVDTSPLSRPQFGEVTPNSIEVGGTSINNSVSVGEGE